MHDLRSDPPRAREAYLYVPRITDASGDADVVLRKLASAFSTITPGEIGEVSLKPADALACGAGGDSARRWTLWGSDGQPLYDVIEVDYMRDLRLASQARWVKLVRVGFTSVWLMSSILRTAFAMYRKTVWQRLQLVYLAALAGTAGLYLFALIKEAYDVLLRSSVNAQVRTQLHLSEKFSLVTVLPDIDQARAGWRAVVGAVASIAVAAARVPAEATAHSTTVVAAIVAVILVLVVCGLPWVRDWATDAYDQVACTALWIRTEWLPRTPTTRRRYFHAWTLVTVVAIAFAAAAFLVPRPHTVALVTGALAIAWSLVGFAARWSIEHTALLAGAMTVLGIPLLGTLGAFGTTMDLLVAGMDYGRIGTLRSDVTGRLLGAIRAALGRGRYDRIHIIACSFGGIVTLDTLFYTAGAGESGALLEDELERIGDIVTIAPPITFVQQLFPRHFDRVRARFREPHKHRWINVCSPLDVLGTPILDEPFDYQHWFEWRDEGWWTRRVRNAMRHQARDAEANPGDPNNICFGVKRNVDFTGWYPLDVRWYELLSLTALRAHSWYWNVSSTTDYNAFHRVVRLLDTQPVLGTSDIAVPSNSLWLRGGGIRDGSPIPTGAYPRTWWPQRLVPDVRVVGLSSRAAVMTHKIVWPDWAALPIWATEERDVDLANGVASVDWPPPASNAANGRPKQPRLWRPHLHCIEINDRAGGRRGNLALRCDRRRCYAKPAKVRINVCRSGPL